MVIAEIIIINEKEYKRTYSDKGFMIERDGVQYEEAIDPLGFEDRIYTETNLLITSNNTETI